jgi:hypothetical protein
MMMYDANDDADDDRICGYGYQRDHCIRCSQLRGIAM